MKKVLRKSILALSLAVSMLLVSACATSAEDDFNKAAETTQEKEDAGSVDETESDTQQDEEVDENGLLSSGTLVMGTSAGFPPFEYIEGGQPVGFDIDVMREIAKEMGLELKINDMEFDTLPTALLQGQIDVIAAGLTATPDRETTMDFSESYYDAMQTIIVMKDSEYASAADIEDKIIGVQSGTTGQYIAEDITDIANVKGFATGMLAVEALKNGSVDAVIIDNNPAKVYLEQYPDDLVLITDQFDVENYVFAVKKGNKVLQEKINEVLTAMREDGRFEEIKSRYLSE